MNEIFLPGKKVLTVRDISSFAVRPENENALIEVKTANISPTVFVPIQMMGC